MDAPSCTLPFAVKYYGKQAFRDWAVRCWHTSLGSGPDLVNALADSHAAAQVLRCAEYAGWIKRVKWCPSREQQFFGVGGLDIKAAKNHASDFHIECWTFEPCRDNEMYRLFCFGGGLEPK